MDNLTMEMRACEKAGFGVSYGKWKATQPVVTKPKPIIVDEHEKRCAYCGKVFYPYRKTTKFCSKKCSALSRYYKLKEQNNG